MGQTSQTAPTFGRRPRTTSTARGAWARALATLTVWTGALRAVAARSAPLSVSAKRDMSMINQRIVVKHAAVVINILVPAQIKLEVAENHVAENIRLALALADIGGVLVVVLVDVLHLMCGMVQAVSVTIIILTKNIAQVILLLILAMMEA